MEKHFLVFQEKRITSQGIDFHKINFSTGNLVPLDITLGCFQNFQFQTGSHFRNLTDLGLFLKTFQETSTPFALLNRKCPWFYWLTSCACHV